MPQRHVRSILTCLALLIAFATVAFAQPGISYQVPAGNAGGAWQSAQLAASSKGKIFVVTIDQPQHRQGCRVQSITADKLVCSRAFGASRTFLPQQVTALILPGEGGLKLELLLGFNGGAAAAIWGTVVLAATCPACAVATGIAALLILGACGAILVGDDQPDRLLYLAPGQHLSGKLGFVQS